MADFFSSNYSAPDSFPRRSGIIYGVDRGINNLANNLYCVAQFREPLVLPVFERRYLVPTDQVVNNNLTLGAIPIVKPTAHQELGLPVNRRREAHMPEFWRPDIPTATPNIPIPIGNFNEIFSNIFTSDRLRGQDFENNMFLTPPSFYSLYPDSPNPTLRKTWLIPEFGGNSELPLNKLVINPPFFSDSVNWPDYLVRHRQPRFDDPPNLLSGVYNIPPGNPFNQTDFPNPIVRNSKYLTLWNYINSQIPNTIPPPALPTAPVGGAVIFGIFQQNKITGYWLGGNNDYT